MNGRRFVLLGISLLSLACAARGFAEGAYQRTDDRKKTLVWNNDPQPGDAAEWSGGRDSEGYAEGAGTLKWFKVQRAFMTGSNLAIGRKATPISAYTGTMAHGKFEGAVTTVDHGKTYHATFADGQRKGRWAVGPAVAKAEKVQTEAPSEERAESETAEKSATAAEKIESAENKTATAEPPAPAEGPSETKPAAAKPNARLAKTESSSTAMSADQLEESPTPQKPVTKKAALAPGAVRAIEQPGRPAEKKAEKKIEKPAEVQPKIKRAAKAEAPKTEPPTEQIESPAEGPLQPSSADHAPSQPANKVTAPSPERSAATHAPSQPTNKTGAADTNPSPSSKQAPADDSIRTLTGPPNSLRTKSTTTTENAPPAPPASAPSVAPPAPPAPAPASTPKLNTVQAMDIADIEARTQGYDLGEYQLPKAEYNASEDTWSVSYAARDANKSAKRLSVIIQDKSGKAEVKK